MLDAGFHIDLGLVPFKKRVEIYEIGRVDMIANQKDKPKILEVMKCCEKLSYVVLWEPAYCCTNHKN